MDARKDQTKNIVELIVCVLAIVGMVNLMNRSDQTILARRPSFQTFGNFYAFRGVPSGADDMRISNLFVEDTLPRLIQYGMVKKYELTQHGTTLSVNGKLWKQTTPFFKNCLLTEILIHNRFNGYAAETHVVDNRSKKLFAAIGPSFAFTFFD